MRDWDNSTTEEISKKDLLQETGISYGQFYRWKRMGLIPEEWFRRRSTFTGQETFLPKRKLLERIAYIQSLKDLHSLEEIAEMLSPESGQRRFGSAELAALGISSRAVALLPTHGDVELSFLDIVCLVMIERLLAQRALTETQIRLAGETLQARFDEVGAGTVDSYLAVVVRDGATVVALFTGNCLFDRQAVVVAIVPIHQLLEEVKRRLRHLDG